MAGLDRRSGRLIPALPSRREALDACRDALDDGAVLLTGPAGAGKTTLLAEIAAESALDWVALDLQPDWAPDDLARSIAAALELDPGTEPRLALRAFLRDEHHAGQRWGLALDEAHLASDDVLEAVRLLSNDRGRPTGFVALVLSGQCPLVRRLMTPRHASLATRLSAHVALRALDRDEAETLLRALVPGLGHEASATIDALYRQTRGVPALLVREGRRLIAKKQTPRAVRVEPARPAITATTASQTTRPAAPLLGDDRPPLRVEDHLIEVGWSGADSDSESDAEPETAPEPIIQADRALSPSPSPSSEPLDDRYAALQAWHEWARNQGRGTIDAETMDDPDTTEAEVIETEEPLDDEELIWVDPSQAFAPYGRLFQNAGGAPGTSP